MTTLRMEYGEDSAGVRARVSDGLWRTAMVLLAIMPFGMAVAHRSSPLFLVLSAVFCLLALAVEGQLLVKLREGVHGLISPLPLAVLGFLAWCLVSVGWSEFKATSLSAFGEFLLPVAATYVLILSLPQRMTKGAFWLLIIACVVACLMMIIELKTSLSVRQALRMRANTFIFNRPVLTMMVLAAPVLGWIAAQGRYAWLLGGALLALFSFIALRSDSGAAVMGLAIGVLVLPVALYLPRFANWLAAILFALALGMAPFVGSLGASYISPEVHKALATGHSRERVAVWQSFEAAAQVHPLVGNGFGISSRMKETSTAAEVPRQLRKMLAIGHPHNAALQVWIELGAIGITLAMAVIVLALRSIDRLPRLTRGLALALMAGAASVAYIGHGAWQGWWIASLGAAIVWLRAVNSIRPETSS